MATQAHKLSSYSRASKRVGRGGKRGKTAGRGTKGQKARSGGNVDPLFEGGRSSLIQRLKKKRGFTSRRPAKQAVSLTALEKKFNSGDLVSAETLRKAGLLRNSRLSAGAKITAVGELKKKLKIAPEVALTAAAEKAILSAGGTIQNQDK
ncbi:MAG TPA: 50S ribosomal protein L15 [Candidatus Moranbacteria bacterium]|nr:50S ribosomal protein L15 [Candidatus Moranbacteria bacterium]